MDHMKYRWKRKITEAAQKGDFGPNGVIGIN